MKNVEKPIVNPFLVLREEFDDWAVLFDPDTCRGFGLNPTGVYVWKLLDSEHTIDDLFEELRGHAKDVPENAREHLTVFVDALVRERLAAYGTMWPHRKERPHPPLAGLTEMEPFTYEAPKLVNLGSGQSALGDCTSHGSRGGSCCGGSYASYQCNSGTCPGSTCTSGSTDSTCCSSGGCHGSGGGCTDGNCDDGYYCCSTGGLPNWCGIGPTGEGQGCGNGQCTANCGSGGAH